MDGQAGATARAIEAASPPQARSVSPMDRTRIIKRPAPDQLAKIPWPTPQQVQIFNERLCDDTGRPYEFSPYALRDIAPHQERYVRGHKAVEEMLRHPMPKYLAHQAEMAERVVAGGDPHERDSWSLAEWQDDQLEKAKGLRAKLKEIVSEAWEIAEPELLKKAEALNLMADELEASERNRAESWGFACAAPWVVSIRKYASTLTDGSRRSLAPADMLA